MFSLGKPGPRVAVVPVSAAAKATRRGMCEEVRGSADVVDVDSDALSVAHAFARSHRSRVLAADVDRSSVRPVAIARIFECAFSRSMRAALGHAATPLWGSVWFSRFEQCPLRIFCTQRHIRLSTVAALVPSES